MSKILDKLDKLCTVVSRKQNLIIEYLFWSFTFERYKRKGCGKMKFKTAILWWIVNNKEHECLEKEDKRIVALMPLVATLFPGINYYSFSGFHEVLHRCVIPVIKKRFPELLTTPAKAIKPKTTTEITEVLPSNGYEWQDNPEWWVRFNNFLANE